MVGRSHSRSGLVAAVVCLVGLLVFLPGNAQAAPGEAVAVGWWTRLPTASAPDGGVNVGSAPDGPNSVAAIRIDLGAGLTSATISAVEAGGSPQTAAVQVCAADDGWAPAAGGALADAPARDCAKAIAFTRGGDGTWTADITPLVAGRTGTASVALVAVGPDTSNPLGVAPSEVQFAAPTATGVAVVTTTAPTTTAAPAPPAPPTTRGTTATPTTRAPVRTTAPPTTNATTDTTVLAFDDPSTTTTIPIAEERALPSITSAGVSSGGGRPIQEAFFLVFIAVVVGVGVGGFSKFAESRAG